VRIIAAYSIALMLAGCAASAPAVTADSAGPSPELQRMSDAFAAREQQIERDKQAKMAQIDELSKAQKQFALAWIACQSAYAGNLARTTQEPPDTIILATFSACGQQEDPVRRSFDKMYQIGDQNPQMAARAMDDMRAASRERLTKEILQIRHPAL
jgi:hypothetical protein